MSRKMRLIYEYMSVDEKKEALRLLTIEREELKKDIEKNKISHSKLVQQILNDTLDRWSMEISELKNDIDNNIGFVGE